MGSRKMKTFTSTQLSNILIAAKKRIQRQKKKPYCMHTVNYLNGQLAGIRLVKEMLKLRYL